jgi:diguanylate cyclase (GGDEF)-like protein
LPSAPNTRILVLTPQRAVEAATAAAWRRLALAVLAALLFVCAVGYLEGKRIVRAIRSLVSAAHSIARGRLYERAVVHGRDELATLGHAFNDMAEQLEGRVEDLNAERARLREVISGFGAALAATHHDQELRRVIVATAVEATAARGGKFISTDGALVECGDTDAGDRFELVVATRDATFGTLVLVGDAFSDDDADTAWSLAAQAAVALDNARLHAIVARQALTDGLTGLDNRRQAEHAVAAEVARVARYGGSFAVVLADIDEFKVLNDTYGHAAGDAVLREIALVLGGAVRDSDVASRWGGEEFLLLLRETELDGAVQLAERVRRELERRTILSPGGAPLRVTASFGVAACTTNEGPFEVVSAADEALYAAKRQGRNRVVGSAGQAEPRSCSAPTREDAAV